MAEVVDPRVARSRAAVLDAATELLLADGLPAVTVEAVLGRSGVARSTLYRHWPGRGELLADVLDRLVPAPQQPPAPGPLRDRLETLALQAAHELQDDRTRLMVSLLHAAQADDDLAGFCHRFNHEKTAPLAAVLADARASGELTTAVPDDDVIALLVGPLFMRGAMMRLPVDGAWVHDHVARVLRGLDHA